MACAEAHRLLPFLRRRGWGIGQGWGWGEAPKVEDGREVTGPMWSKLGAVGQAGERWRSSKGRGNEGTRHRCLPEESRGSAAQDRLIRGSHTGR